jgi:ERCC4-type nuclease
MSCQSSEDLSKDKRCKVVVNSRELDSGVVKALEKQDIEIELTILETADYVVNHRIDFVRMTIDDFLKSIFKDRKLYTKIGGMASSYDRPILIIEGEDPFFPGRTINPSFIQGFFNTIAVSFRVPTLYTLNETQTSEVILSIAMAKHYNKILGQQNSGNSIGR